jgi:hypothetical protein
LVALSGKDGRGLGLEEDGPAEQRVVSDGHDFVHLVEVSDSNGASVEPVLEQLAELEQRQSAPGHVLEQGLYLGPELRNKKMYLSYKKFSK